MKILFLGISIFFSFGFTTYQSICGLEEIKVEENAHSCCQSTTKSECTKSTSCTAECCLEPVQFYVLSQFVIESNKAEKVTVFELNKFFKKSFNIQLNVIVEKPQTHPNFNYLVRNLSGKQIISLKQSWLI